MWGNWPHERQEREVYQKPPRSVNPGAAGNSGFHKKITFIRMVIEGKQFKDMEIFELDRQSRLF